MHSVKLAAPDDFDGWRTGAKAAWAAGMKPSEIQFDLPGAQPSMFGEDAVFPDSSENKKLTVPAAFLDLARTVICHRDPERFVLLFTLLTRLQHDKLLLRKTTDSDVYRANRLAKEVRRDMHKMKAFVRFRKTGETEDGMENFVAWFEPSHFIVRATAPFFTRRFSNMRWSILTPDACAHWDGKALSFTDGVPKSAAPAEDALEDYWRSYYASIFNPARLKIDAMTSEMPKKYLKNLPEAALIPDMIRAAHKLERGMIDARPSEPQPAMMAHKQPVKSALIVQRDAPETLKALNMSIHNCRNCPLWKPATQAVVGTGPQSASLMIIGEQPGDHEDLQGKPFVGPAGQILTAMLEREGIDDVYITNAVKHFKFEARGKRRIHKTPSAGEIDHCRWWLNHEIDLVKPKTILALGASAFRAVTGRSEKLSAIQGANLKLDNGIDLIATYHPSYILRLRDENEKARISRILEYDLRTAYQMSQR